MTNFRQMEEFAPHQSQSIVIRIKEWFIDIWESFRKKFRKEIRVCQLCGHKELLLVWRCTSCQRPICNHCVSELMGVGVLPSCFNALCDQVIQKKNPSQTREQIFLEEPIALAGNTRYQLREIVSQVKNNKPLSENVEIPLHQLKVVLFYGLWGLPAMTAITIKKYLTDLNIFFDFSQLRRILNEMQQEGFIDFEEKLNKQIHTWERFWIIPRRDNRMTERSFPYIYRDDYPKGPPQPVAVIIDSQPIIEDDQSLDLQRTTTDTDNANISYGFSEKRVDVVQIKQLHKKDGEIKEGGTINLPINKSDISSIQRLEDFYGDILTHYRPEQKFEQWVKERRTHTDQEVKVSAFAKDVLRKRLQEEIHESRLREPVPNTPFVLDDVVYSVFNKQPFAETIKISIDQMKVVMYHGLMGGRDLITTRVADYLLKLNIDYEYKKTGMILKSFVEAGLLKHVDFVTKNKFNARKYLFSEYNHKNFSQHLDDVVEKKNKEFPSLQPKKYNSVYHLNPEHLNRRIPNTNFSVGDIVYGLKKKQPFAKVFVEDEELIKLILRYGFTGRELITMDIVRECRRSNIEYRYQITGRLLREMVDENLIGLEEKTAKKSKNRYFVWKFHDSQYKKELGTNKLSNRLNEYVEQKDNVYKSQKESTKNKT